jgi:hypothetical protein
MGVSWLSEYGAGWWDGEIFRMAWRMKLGRRIESISGCVVWCADMGYVRCWRVMTE